MSQSIQLENQSAQPIDDATRAALEAARAELARGEGMTLEAARALVQKQHQIWRQTEREVLAA